MASVRRSDAFSAAADRLPSTDLPVIRPTPHHNTRERARRETVSAQWQLRESTLTEISCSKPFLKNRVAPDIAKTVLQSPFAMNNQSNNNRLRHLLVAAERRWPAASAEAYGIPAQTAPDLPQGR